MRNGGVRSMNTDMIADDFKGVLRTKDKRARTKERCGHSCLMSAQHQAQSEDARAVTDFVQTLLAVGFLDMIMNRDHWKVFTNRLALGWETPGVI